jgi:hypothetical protein
MIITGKYAASNFLVRQSLTIDTEKNCSTKSSKILSLFTVKEGCKKLPKLDYILMFRTLYAKCEPCGLDDFESASMIQLSLVYHKNRRLIVHESNDFNEIKSMAKQLADDFYLKIRDSASDRRNPKWINSETLSASL